MSYSHNNVPINPGAYLVDGTTGSTNILDTLPIFSSIPSLIGMGYENTDNTYYILPGYKIIRYNTINYVNELDTIDNTNGTKIMYNYPSTVNNCDSIRLYYKNVEIPSVYTYTPYPDKSTAPSTTSNSSTLEIGSYRENIVSKFPGAYMINSVGDGCMPIFYSISAMDNITPLSGNIEDCVLVMPGYKLILWFNQNYTGNNVEIDNTYGTSIIVGQSDGLAVGGWNNNQTQSCQLYFYGNLIDVTDIVA